MGQNRIRTILASVVLTTAVLAGKVRVEHLDLTSGHAVHEDGTEMGCAVGVTRTGTNPWGDFNAGRLLLFLNDLKALPEPVPAVGRQSFWSWV